MMDYTELRRRICVDGRLGQKFLTADLPGTGGAIKLDSDDFIVTEIPAYAPSGSGTHIYFGLRKRGVDTNAAIRQVAKIIGASARDFGVAGLKDARAVTEQTASIEHLSAAQIARLENIDTGSVRVTWVSRHTNKLKTGHLAANRFVIRLRQLDEPLETAHQRAKAIMAVLTSRGVPNYFGPQRFGQRNNNWLLGLHLLTGDSQAFVDELLGNPADCDSQPQQNARRLYDAGELEKSLASFPGACREERAVLSSLIKKPDNTKAAAGRISKFLKRFATNALQSAIFNIILEARLEDIDSVRVGDWAVKTAGSASFTIEADALERERQRARDFEISLTALMPGSKTKLAIGDTANYELKTLEMFGLTPESFAGCGKQLRGERRAVRYPIAASETKAATHETGDYIELSFTAPPGCYATSLTREITKQ